MRATYHDASHPQGYDTMRLYLWQARRRALVIHYRHSGRQSTNFALKIHKYGNQEKKENLTPAFPTHPGEILKDEIEYRGISQRDLAEKMGIAYSALNEILNAKRPVTEKTALLFEAALGVNAEPLLKLQMKYNIQTTKEDSSFMKRLANVRRIAAL